MVDCTRVLLSLSLFVPSASSLRSFSSALSCALFPSLSLSIYPSDVSFSLVLSRQDCVSAFMPNDRVLAVVSSFFPSSPSLSPSLLLPKLSYSFSLCYDPGVLNRRRNIVSPVQSRHPLYTHHHLSFLGDAFSTDNGRGEY